MEATIPIREISRLTGVNSVTLRAWERRYGLIKPSRTHKGHRLYCQDDIELIKKIQTWLARGLAIGKISELLDSNQFSYELEIENIWQTYFFELSTLMSDLNLGKMDAYFNQLFSVYPAEIIADQLIAPMLENLSEDVFGNKIKKSILINRLSEYLLMLTQRQRQQVSGKRLAIIQLTSSSNFLTNTLLYYGLTMNQFRSELIGLSTATEMVFATKQLALDGIVVYNDYCSSLGDFLRELMQLVQRVSVPIIVGGELSTAIGIDFPAHVTIVRRAGQQELMSTIHDIFLV